MQGAEWARLSHPFPAEAFGWHVVELSSDRVQARLAPYLATTAVSARLDATCGPAGWSFQLSPLGPDALVCNLTVAGVTRAAVAQAAAGLGEPETSPRVRPTMLAEIALSNCMVLFGAVLPTADDDWVDYDPDAAVPLYTPVPLTAGPDAARLGEVPLVAPAPDAGAPLAPAPASVPAAPELSESAEERRPDGHLAIDRLIERLKSEGLGKEAAKLVVAHHGYGRTPEEGRELYRKLRELLLEKAVVPS